VKPALLPLSTVRPEDGFQGKGLGARQWMVIDEQSVIHAIELDCFADRRIDYFGLAENRGFMAADVLEAIKSP
jgi:hypothetical protein